MESHVRYKFWTELLNRANEKTYLHTDISPSNGEWIGKFKDGLSFEYKIAKQYGIARLWIYHHGKDPAKEYQKENQAVFETLKASKDTIEKEFGEQLKWEVNKKSCCIYHRLEGGYEDEWSTVQAAMIDAMIRLEKALRPHIAF